MIGLNQCFGHGKRGQAEIREKKIRSCRPAKQLASKAKNIKHRPAVVVRSRRLALPKLFLYPLLVLVWEAYLEAFELNLVGLFPSPNLDHASHTNTNTATRQAEEDEDDEVADDDDNNNRSSCLGLASGLCLRPCTRHMASSGPRHNVLMVVPTYSRTANSCQASTDSNTNTGTNAKPEMAVDEIASQGTGEWKSHSNNTPRDTVRVERAQQVLAGLV
ncbi:uncharacterized protein BDZ83DRAFT_654032 [Colletotrichum acutatum]|uniref:Uncharacterized protein n=1 Tax=Glomerella acutata TaxID=27357 RepID=A0AAD8UII6_GLOAC|nr:uncharacterized protein BDZ83DRAFT_654032 [Colletotrichum acutatum]KAK1722329.1 hypothetical protein BDZ83DRAFT_654032 [Colletotrichum acutatum]